jgi:hypothetical protein
LSNDSRRVHLDCSHENAAGGILDSPRRSNLFGEVSKAGPERASVFVIARLTENAERDAVGRGLTNATALRRSEHL